MVVERFSHSLFWTTPIYLDSFPCHFSFEVRILDSTKQNGSDKSWNLSPNDALWDFLNNVKHINHDPTGCLCIVYTRIIHDNDSWSWNDGFRIMIEAQLAASQWANYNNSKSLFMALLKKCQTYQSRLDYSWQWFMIMEWWIQDYDWSSIGSLLIPNP